ncbi:ferlin [Peptoniphilus catoniae]|uniref:ferlin n=1 Tax=Peptoniphilus catoniae TaxID=1660341 RepID=UPI0015D657C0|nr:ferlin [Peptoniphilus catoniae]
MKKKLLLISLLSLSLALNGCGKKDETANAKTDKSSEPSVTVLDNEDKNASEENPSNEDKNASEENPSMDNTVEELAGDKTAEGESKEEIKTTSINKETINNLIENSDYISRVRIQMDPENNATSTFIEDYRGDLSRIEMTLPKNLLANREYIIFYVDGAKGQIEPTRGDESFIEIESTNDANLEYIEKVFESSKAPTVKDSSEKPKTDQKDKKD